MFFFATSFLDVAAVETNTIFSLGLVTVKLEVNYAFLISFHVTLGLDDVLLC